MKPECEHILAKSTSISGNVSTDNQMLQSNSATYGKISTCEDRIDMSTDKKSSGGTIAQNRKARHEYFIEEKIEAGLVLQGWEVKAIRSGRMTITESYVTFRKGEAFLFNSQITPLLSASTHVDPEATRTRKLLLSKRQIEKLMAAMNQKGYTCVPLATYWKGAHIKCEIALVKGKQLHDKRATEKDRDWNRDKQRVFRSQ
jgi:SsrA-binding protein